jgi:hypothetical protein
MVLHDNIFLFDLNERMPIFILKLQLFKSSKYLPIIKTWHLLFLIFAMLVSFTMIRAFNFYDLQQLHMLNL